MKKQLYKWLLFIGVTMPLHAHGVGLNVGFLVLLALIPIVGFAIIFMLLIVPRVYVVDWRAYFKGLTMLKMLGNILSVIIPILLWTVFNFIVKVDNTSDLVYYSSLAEIISINIIFLLSILEILTSKSKVFMVIVNIISLFILLFLYKIPLIRFEIEDKFLSIMG